MLEKLARSTVWLVMLVAPSLIAAVFYCYLVSLGRGPDGTTTSLLDFTPPFLFSFAATYIILLAILIPLRFLFGWIGKCLKRRDI
ncbi:hypothetical protein U1839_13110 [Sphingomonas sp. RT2P30]|uniref:hypothetical protein n=1 Tax=Parasphingomonas halimpatiens TaxID=3096162 RepID=UPI002FCBFF7B